MARVVRKYRCSTIFCSIAALILLSGCVTTPRVSSNTDGRKIADDPTLLQGKSDFAAYNANLDIEMPTGSARGCMAQKGYTLVPRHQAEDVRAAYAAGAQRVIPSR